MKGTLKVKDDTVTIEEFSYPLEQFLIDEPDFKAPKADQLVYRRGEGTLLYIGEDTKKDEFPLKTMKLNSAVDSKTIINKKQKKE